MSKRRFRACDNNSALRAIGRARDAVLPVDSEHLLDLGIGFHGALEEIRKGDGKWDDMNTLALASNVSVILCEANIGAEYIDISYSGQLAIINLYARSYKTGRYTVTGDELKALQALLELHDAQLRHQDCTRSVMVQCLEEITRRMKAGNTMGSVQ